MPERFDLSYVDSGGARRRPAMVHRALFGSIERFLGILLEHHRGALPAWLAPEQVVVAPVGGEAGAYAGEVLDRLLAAGVRVRLDDRAESLSKRIVDAHRDGVPYVAVIGPREQAERKLRLRERSGDQRDLGLDAAVEELAALGRPPRAS